MNTVLLLTAPGVSAIAVVRLSGPLAESFLKEHFRGALRAGKPVHVKLVNGDRELDDPVVVWDASRQMADICTHGGRWVVHSVMELAKRDGFVTTSSEEALPLTAVDADDILEQEILQYLPLARTREAIQTLLNQREAWRYFESADPPRGPSVAQILSDHSLHWLLHPPRVAVIGIPNVGKSTLANALLGRQHSIVADMPGTTRDYVEEMADISGLAAHLMDTPGLRVSGDQIEMAAIGISSDQIAQADLQIVLLDPTQSLDPQQELVDRYPRAMLVRTKCDTRDSWPTIGGRTPLRVSGTTGEGLEELRLAIRAHFGCSELPHRRPCPWTPRQHEWIRHHLTEQ